MKGLQEYLLVYSIVQVMGLIILWTSWKHSRIARLLFAALFLWASVVNMKIGLTDPDVYLNYGWMALPVYQELINGWFSHYHYIVVPAIAVGQFFIGLGMLLKGRWVQLACLGAIVFLLAICPLMVGSGFPFPLVTAIGAYLVLKKDRRLYPWQNEHRTAGTKKVSLQ